MVLYSTGMNGEGRVVFFSPILPFFSTFKIFLLKSHVQEQTEKILSSEEELRRYSSACREKENRISILEQQLGSLSQTNEERSKSSEKISQQMLELQNLLNDRNQKISHLEISLSEVSEEKELMRSEMTKQSQELLEQVRDLRARLDEVRVRGCKET